MNISERNRKQIEESRSELNRYYFHEKYGRDALDNAELLMFYIECGGARDFAQKLAKEEKDENS